MRKIVIIIVFTFISHLAVQTAHANTSVSAEKFNVSVTINRDYSAYTVIGTELKNNDSNNLIGGYNIDLPFRNPTGIKTSFNGSEIGYTETNNEGFITLNIDFGSWAIRPNDTALLTIEFKSLNTISGTEKFRELYVPGSGLVHTVNNSSYSINYPKDFGKPTMIANRTAQIFDTGTHYEVKKTDAEAIYLLWGEEASFKVEQKLDVINKEDHSIKNIFSSIPNSKFQSISYDLIKDIKTGLYDELNNQFFLLEVDRKKTISVNYKASIDKIPGSLEEYPNTYPWTFKPDDNFGKVISEYMPKDANNILKIQWLSDYLKSYFEAKYKQGIETNSLDNLWNVKDDETEERKISSLEYCVYIVSFAQSLNVQARIEYGYLLSNQLPNLNLTDPHVWCVIRVESKNILVDPYLEDVTGLYYFGEESFFDRLVMGIWHPEQNYNDVLGLLSKDSIQTAPNITLSLERSKLIKEEGLISTTVKFPDSVYSGFNYKGEITVKNTTKEPFLIEDVLIDGKSYLNKVAYTNDLYPVALPGVTNRYNLNNINTTTFFYDGTKDLEVKVVGKDVNSEVTYFEEVSFEPHKRFWLIMFLISNSALFITIFLIFRIKRRAYIK